MKLYLIKQDENTGWDTYDSAVVSAESEEIARNMHPGNGRVMDFSDEYSGWCSCAENVEVIFLGNTDIKERRVICSSYNAG